MSNTSRREKEEIRTEILDTFDNKIEVSGYSEMERRKIMRRGNLSFKKLLDLEKKERRRLHRLGNTTLGLRYQKKLLDTTNWYRHKEEQSNGEWEEPGEERKRARSIKKTRKQHQDPVAVIFVERSPEGKLITSLREEEQKMQQISTQSEISREDRTSTKAVNLEIRSLWRDPMLGFRLSGV